MKTSCYTIVAIACALLLPAGLTVAAPPAASTQTKTNATVPKDNKLPKNPQPVATVKVDLAAASVGWGAASDVGSRTAEGTVMNKSKAAFSGNRKAEISGLMQDGKWKTLATKSVTSVPAGGQVNVTSSSKLVTGAYKKLRLTISSDRSDPNPSNDKIEK
jgi:hypothetical protein